jgi:hypothetical protein
MYKELRCKQCGTESLCQDKPSWIKLIGRSTIKQSEEMES